MDKWLKKDLRQRIIKSLIIHTIVVLAIVITTNCRIQAPAENKIPEIPGRENIKLMPVRRHSMQVPIGTQIGDTITAHDGVWMSEQACARMAAVLILAEKLTKTLIEK